MLFLRGSTGLGIAADRWGEPGNPLVLLQHGGGQTRHAWKGTGEALAAAGFCAYALDARGHGDSEWAADRDYSQDRWRYELASLLHQQGDVSGALRELRICLRMRPGYTQYKDMIARLSVLPGAGVR